MKLPDSAGLSPQDQTRLAMAQRLLDRIEGGELTPPQEVNFYTEIRQLLGSVDWGDGQVDRSEAGRQLVAKRKDRGHYKTALKVLEGG